MCRRSWGSAGPLLPRWLRHMTVVMILLVCATSTGLARETGSPNTPRFEVTPDELSRGTQPRERYSDTLWIFDADFEDLFGDNAGWVSKDRSGTLPVINHWHKDTIRINGFTHLGDSTWWCGTYNACWRQPRGYGNDWNDILVRDFPEVAALTDPGDVLVLEYDQRIAMEKEYDYGYTEVSTDGGASWTAEMVVCNPGFAGTPGISQDWDSINPATPGHVSLDLGAYAGQEISIRFRFDSDVAYSSQDQYNNPPRNSCLDGAWQLDNITLWTTDPNPVVIFLDDCESPGSNGWNHDNIPGHSQTGITFWRGLYGTDIWTNRPFTCDEREGWMYAAVDPMTSRMVDGQDSWLISPPIDISGANKLVGQWDMWVDLPRPTEDVFDLWLASGDGDTCISQPTGFVDDEPGAWYGGPFWGTWTDNWDAFAGNDCLMIRWIVWNSDDTPPGVEHMGGIFVNRQRVGIPVGEPETAWEYSQWTRFNDWFRDQLAEAMLDSAIIRVNDVDDIASVTLVADNGATSTSYPCRRVDPEGNDWVASPPYVEMLPGTEIHYYFEAVDGVGGVSTFPPDAPDVTYEMSILPITASTEEPGILLVDKVGQLIPGEQRDFATTSEDYYREALDILGYEYDVYDVELPTGSTDQSDGPDSSAFKYYDTQIWFTGNAGGFLIKPVDQINLIDWLGQASGGKERNLLLTGNDIGCELIEAGEETLGFYEQWLAAEYLGDAVGEATVDSVPGLRDAAGGYDFMTYDDGECTLRGGCPWLAMFDVVQPYPGVPAAELVAEYVKLDEEAVPAGVAYTDSTGYQTVTLGFGIEFMSGNAGVGLPDGHYSSGASDRVDLLANIMEYFGTTPATTPTGVGDEAVVFALGVARPNPFGPNTTLSYSIPREGPARIRVIDVAGRVVATLVEGSVAAGEHTVVWDGRTDEGPRAASGVYFVRLEAAGRERSQKLVLLK